MGKNVVVKFCGQCKPSIKLYSVYEWLKGNDKTNTYQLYSSDIEADVCLVISACPIQCVWSIFSGPELRVFPKPKENVEDMAKRIVIELDKIQI